MKNANIFLESGPESSKRIVAMGAMGAKVVFMPAPCFVWRITNGIQGRMKWPHRPWLRQPALLQLDLGRVDHHTVAQASAFEIRAWR